MLSPTMNAAKSTCYPSDSPSSAAKAHTKSKEAPRRSLSCPARDETKTTSGPPGDDVEVAIPESDNQAADATSNGNGARSVAKTHYVPAPYTFLALAAETLEDIERVRIATENRARALTHPEQRICLSEADPHVKLANGIASELATTEHQAELALKRVLRQTPLGEWVKNTVGIGEKQAGRLLGVIGDPSIRIDGETGEVHERTVGQLRSYCGYGDAKEQKRRKGQQGNWNAKARMRTYLIAESCMKSPTSPYRKVYEDGRAKYEDAKHDAPCAQCGKKGKPAEIGTDLRDGHKHARALRLVAKAVLKDLWLAARET